MRNDVYRLLTLAVACNISGDEAYEMLHHTYVNDFERYYKQVVASARAGEVKPNVLDAMINFTIKELPIRSGVDGSVLYTLKSRRSEIVRMFIHEDVSSLVTKMASRDTVLNMIRTYLKRENEHSAMYTRINSTRVAGIFTQFLEVFKENSAHAFRWDDSFRKFVMHTFIYYFYSGHKKDIWAYLREVDTARREVEQSVVQERTLTVVRDDDLLIHDMVANISEVNTLMFRHSGQSDDARGVSYDIYYLMLCTLCEERVKEINAELGEELLVFVDPLDRREYWPGKPPNAGIAAKITNAKELVPKVFSYVREVKLNTSNLSDLRDQCFVLGKHDREGRNCIWVDVVEGGETAHHLDDRKSNRNYESFDKVVKGVISVYTMMTELERRGMYLVDSYVPDIFQDPNLIRYLDYLSAIPHIALIRELQTEDIEDFDRGNRVTYSGDLLDFEGMLDKYAGSAVNNHANIRENRYHSIIHGFLEKPRIKQTVMPLTPYDKLKVIASVFDAIPHNFFEFALSINRAKVPEYQFSTWFTLPMENVLPGRYNELYFNRYLQRQPDLAKYYLGGNATMQSYDLGLLPAMQWTLRQAAFSGVTIADAYGVYLPLEQTFFMYSFPQDVSAARFCVTPMDVVSFEAQGKGLPNTTAYRSYGVLGPAEILSEWHDTMGDAIKFPVEVGFSNLDQRDILKVLDSNQVVGTYRTYVKQYQELLAKSVRLVHSFIDLFRTMFVECLYWAQDEQLSIDERKAARMVLGGLCTGEFPEDELNWVLERIHSTEKIMRINHLEWVTGKRDPAYRPMDTVVLAYCFDEVAKDSMKWPVYEEVLRYLKSEKTPAQKFVALYAVAYTQTEFLSILRDSFSLLINSMPSESSTLVCELNTRFGVVDVLQKFNVSSVDYGIYLPTVGAEHIKKIVSETKFGCYRTFQTLIDELIHYVQSCEGEISKLVNYNVSVDTTAISRFSTWGDTFMLLPAYENIRELTELRRRAVTDSAGFFMLNGSYFRAINNGTQYYVHRSGRMIAESEDGYSAASFNLQNEDDLRLYRDILLRGLLEDG